MALLHGRNHPPPALTPPRRPSTTNAVPPGFRVYAIGDVHGRFDLLEDLLAEVENDNRVRGVAHTHVVMLGDLIDRGPQSRDIIDFFLKSRPSFAKFLFIMGNHEDMLLTLLDHPDIAYLRQYLRHGGLQTFESYGAPSEILELHDRFRLDTLLAYVPDAHRAFLRGMHDGVQFGDYFLTHAGIRPGIAVDLQDRQDLRWIRTLFLESEVDHGVVVIHGHTVRGGVERRSNRIGIDTGAYATGVLTALGLEGTEQWLLQTHPERAISAARR